MNFELKRPTDYSDKAIINEIKRVSVLIDKPLSMKKFNSISKYSASTIEKRFGGWLKALQKAGLDKSYWYTDNKEITREYILSELKSVSKVLGRNNFTQKEFVKQSQIKNRGIFSRKFGSFNQLMKEAGFDIPLKSRKYTDNDRFENLLKVWSFYGRQPSYSEMKKVPSNVGPKAYVTRWGSWTKALLAFVEKVNNDLDSIELHKTEILEINNDKHLHNIKKKSITNSRDVPLGLRYDILKRDRFRCVICGRSPATNIKIELQVDHITPFSKGGKTVRQNLRTLCNECNSGKSSKVE